MPTKNPKPQSFRGTLEHLQSGLGWVIVRVPFDVKRTWGGSRVKIRGAVNGATFRTSLFAQKNGSHFLLINKQLQKAAGIRAGSTAEFHLEVDTAPRLATVPQELERIFQQSKRLRKWFDSLSYSYRYEFSRQISLPKGAETRKRRAEQIAELLLETMEAERELPPLIKTALDQNPLAREGWNVMTPTQRRGHLMGVFYSRTPEARARRLQKAMEAAKTARSRRAS
jgi:uncharacterized protein YdeI (YjbR/CyaY-like superfamily)